MARLGNNFVREGIREALLAQRQPDNSFSDPVMFDYFCIIRIFKIKITFA